MSRNLLRLVLFALVPLAGCTVELQHDLPEDDANDIYVLLDHNGISVTKTKEEGGNEPRYIISVPKQDVSAAARLLKDHSLPRPKADGLAVFKRMKGMIPTQTEERAMFIEALGGEVSNSLNRLPGVLEARAIVMIPENNDLTQPDKKPQPSASVFLKYTPSGGKPPTEMQVKEFVASAVPEMKKEFVTVLMAEAQPLGDEKQNDEDRIQSSMGLRMEKGSVGTFRAMVAIGSILILALVLLVLYLLLVRKPGGGGGGNGSRPSRVRPAEG